MKIQKPTLEDIPQLLPLWEKQYHYHHQLDAEYYVKNTKELREKFVTYIKNAINSSSLEILAAYNNKQIVGFITFQIETNDYLDTKIKQYGSILELFVLDSYRGQGIGKKLLQTAEEYFRSEKIAYAHLEVAVKNNLAINIYKHFGYELKITTLYKKL